MSGEASRWRCLAVAGERDGVGDGEPSGLLGGGSSLDDGVDVGLMGVFAGMVLIARFDASTCESRWNGSRPGRVDTAALGARVATVGAASVADLDHRSAACLAAFDGFGRAFGLVVGVYSGDRRGHAVLVPVIIVSGKRVKEGFAMEVALSGGAVRPGNLAGEVRGELSTAIGAHRCWSVSGQSGP